MMLHDQILSAHAEIRMKQRGFRRDDVELVLAAASPFSSEAYLLTNSDVDREIANRIVSQHVV